jgi:hypothetical protein
LSARTFWLGGKGNPKAGAGLLANWAPFEFRNFYFQDLPFWCKVISLFENSKRTGHERRRRRGRGARGKKKTARSALNLLKKINLA